MDLDYDKLLELAAEMGFRLMESGAEIYRVEESIQRILLAYQVKTGEVFAIPNCIIVSLTTPAGHALTRVRRMPSHGTDIDQLERYNALCRRLCAEAPGFQDAMEQLQEIHTTRRKFSMPVQLGGYFLGTGMFTLFFGGTPVDGLCGGLCGIAIGLCLFLTTRLGANLFFKTIAAGAVSALLAILFVTLGLGHNQDKIIIGALMALVPGIAITNAMRDIMAGDMVSGIAKAGEALLIGAAIALGTAFAIGIANMLWGG